MKQYRGFDFSGMDTTVRPQDDFYRYANGGWCDRTAIPPAESRWGSFIMLRYDTDKRLKAIVDELESMKSVKEGTPERLIRDFMRSGMDLPRRAKLGVTPLADWIRRIRAAKTVGDLQDLASDLNCIGTGVPLGAGIDQDAKDTTKYILHIFQDGLGMPDRDYYLNDDAESVRVRTAYERHVEALFKLMGRTKAEATAETKAVLALERKIAEASMNKVDRREIEKTYNKRSLKELQKLAPQIDWTRYMKRLGASSETSFIVMQPQFVATAAALMASELIETWKSYMEWHLVNDFSGALSPAFVKESFAFYGTVMTGTKVMKPLWRRVLAATNATLGEPLGRLYVQKYFSERAKRVMNELVDDLFAAYEKRIKGLDWMSAPTKKKALKKLHAMGRKIGYPDKWRSYAALRIDPTDYVGNLMRSALFEHKREMRKLGKPVDRSEWFMTPQTVNAYNAPNMNEIAFPAAILQPPFFDPDGDPAVNYGAIGAVIGHEITHGFDDEGAKFDEKGNLKEWWTKEDKKLFQRKGAIVVSQFNQYEVADGVKVNGKLTLGENIADLGGLAIAYDALQTYLARHGREDMQGVPPEQRYFLGFALFERENVRPEFEKMATLTDPHSPGKFRINGPVSNFEPFYEAFGVKKGDALWRDKKDRTTVW